MSVMFIIITLIFYNHIALKNKLLISQELKNIIMKRY